MPKLPPFALADTAPRPQRPWYLLVFFALFAFPLYGFHARLLNLPYFWDEHGQFIPTALDILRHGWWVTRTAVPNVHPPGVEAYLVLWYKLFGYSIVVTRLAMLALASVGVLFAFLLAVRLSSGTTGAPAFWPPLFLIASPLFFMQSLLAQLDMPAMVFTLVAVWLFLQQKYKEAAIVCVALVLAKETGLVTPFVLFVLLLRRRDWKQASWFALPALALAVWLLILHRATGYWLGDPGFAHYNVGYSLHPVRALFSFLRRLFYIFIAEFRWVGTLAILFAWKRTQLLRTPDWRIIYPVVIANVLIVSVLGGAELERYLLPVLPFFYIASAVAFSTLRRDVGILSMAAMILGLIVSIFWNPPYPFPFENNFAMVDFVRLQQGAASYVEENLPNQRIATAWPYTAALRNPDYGYVKHPHQVIETNDFHLASIQRIPASSYDVLIAYTRTWAPADGVIAISWVRSLLGRFYEWEPDISDEDCARLGMKRSVSWSDRGQTITIYTH